jgi:preprotein translocase subunit SecY
VAREATIVADTYGSDEPGGEPPLIGDLGRRLLFTLGALVIYRLGTYIPLPGIDPHIFQEIFSRNAGGILGPIDMFSGGALGRMTIFAISITPYISASFLLQLAIVVSKKLQALKNGGPAGRRTLNQYVRIAALLLAAVQAYAMAIGLEGLGGGRSAVIDPGLVFRLSTVVTLTAGTALLIWLCEQITERGVGNGLALIIFSGIAARMPNAVGQLLEQGRVGSMSYLEIDALLVGAVAVIAFVVFMERAQRRIRVHYPGRQIGQRTFSGKSSYLPLKLNSAGIIPPLFASSLLVLSAIVGSGVTGRDGWFAGVTSYVGQGHPLYLLLYVALIIFFCLFYTAIVVNPAEMADDLGKYHGFVPGIRPGKNTADYLDYVLTRLTLVGALYLSAVCVLPETLNSQLGLTFYFGGTSVLILVCVTLDFFGELGARLQGGDFRA